LATDIFPYQLLLIDVRLLCVGQNKVIIKNHGYWAGAGLSPMLQDRYFSGAGLEHLAQNKVIIVSWLLVSHREQL
jgi:hypothetical protein